MDRYVMRHPETGGVALIPESSMPVHRGLGWLRVSDAIAEEAMHGVDVAQFVDAPDLDAPTAEDTDESADTATEPAAKPRSKEK